MWKRYFETKETQGMQRETTSASPPGLFPRYNTNSDIQIQDNGVNRASSNILESLAMQGMLQGISGHHQVKSLYSATEEFQLN